MNKNDKDIHRGHRARIRRRYLKNLGTDFAEHEALELLLSYSIPRKDTNPIAHALIERFGSINKMASASVDKIAEVEGVGINSAILIKMITTLAQKYVKEKKSEPKRIETLKKSAQHAYSCCVGALDELVYAVLMDSSLNIIDTALIGVGYIDEVKPLARTVLELAIVKRASVVIVFHNHINASTLPSKADMEFTNLLERELEMVGIHLLEHIIIAGNKYNAIMKYARNDKEIYKSVDVDKYYSDKEDNTERTLKNEGSFTL